MIAGFLVGSVEKSIPIYRLAEFGFIHDMWVEPPFRRRGVARLLVEEAVRRFAAMGVSQVRLETADANDSARRLFAACGFRVGTVDMLRETGD
jgi:ribosomal protein S18 acetylase RimI-like enzyme